LVTSGNRRVRPIPEGKMTEPESIPKIEQLAALAKKKLQKSARP
jgi:hypothetical protein